MSCLESSELGQFQGGRSSAWFRAVAQHEISLKRGKVDCCFVGDSLTAFWNHNGRPIWDLEFHRYRCINIGIAADRVEDILYRVSCTDFAAAQPDVFVLLAGTNNLGKEPPDSPAHVSDQIIVIAEALKRKSPRAKVFVLSVLPSGRQPDTPLRRRIVAANALLKAKAQSYSNWCRFVDVHDTFLQENRYWKRGATLDGTHLTLHGYDLMARVIAPLIRAAVTPAPAKE